jgi:hypothetical protein
MKGKERDLGSEENREEEENGAEDGEKDQDETMRDDM